MDSHGRVMIMEKAYPCYDHITLMLRLSPSGLHDILQKVADDCGTFHLGRMVTINISVPNIITIPYLVYVEMIFSYGSICIFHGQLPLGPGKMKQCRMIDIRFGEWNRSLCLSNQHFL